MSDRVKGALAQRGRALLQRLAESFRKAICDSYRPERHYMRGSGPKSRSINSKQGPGSKQT